MSGISSGSYRSITTDRQLRQLCRELADCPTIAIDTEFVAEHTYRPVLCLVQVAAGQQLALIDPLAIKDLKPFWEVLANPGHETIVHAGRRDAAFCLEAVGRFPAGLFDVQVAAGLVGIEYPAGYSNLVFRLLGIQSKKQETRTDWRRRPLSQRQIDYALEDVLHLHALRELLGRRLSELGRLDWLREEMESWQEEIIRAGAGEHWRSISGFNSLNAQGQAIVRELYYWRESEARRRNQPVRRVLRDDLLFELARRQTADPKQISALRGMERPDLRRRLDDIAACIRRGLAAPEAPTPEKKKREPTPQLSVLGQFLFAALGNVCREAQLAPGLVGGPNDIRELLAYRAAPDQERPPPKLARGWRAAVVGQLFDKLLSGQTSVYVGDPQSDFPLRFESRKHSTEGPAVPEPSQN